MEETKQVQNANAPEEKPQGVDKKVKNILNIQKETNILNISHRIN